MHRAAAVTLLACLGACGGSKNPSEPTPPPSTNPFKVTITTSGVNPKELTVPPGTRVLFINNDTRRRYMTSDPHPEHDQCPQIDLLLNPGQSRETENLNTSQTCGYHDHDDPGNSGVQGRIIIRP